MYTQALRCLLENHTGDTNRPRDPLPRQTIGSFEFQDTAFHSVVLRTVPLRAQRVRQLMEPCRWPSARSVLPARRAVCRSFLCQYLKCNNMQFEKERNVLFNDALNTFYLRLYGVRHMVKDHSDSEKGNPLPPHRLLLSINSKGSHICTIPQTG